MLHVSVVRRLCILLMFLYVLPIRADINIEEGEITSIYEDRIHELKTIQPTARQKDSAERVIKQYQSDAYQKKIEEIKMRLNSQYVDNAYQNIDKKQSEYSDITDTSARLYVFISSSMPKETLRNYMIDLAGISQATVVLRGFIGGITEISPTIKYIDELRRKDTSCKGQFCERYNTEVVVDPYLFRRYGIKLVPAVTYVGEFEKILECSEGDTTHSVAKDVHTRFGDASIDYILEHINRSLGNRSKNIERMIRKIRS